MSGIEVAMVVSGVASAMASSYQASTQAMAQRKAGREALDYQKWSDQQTADQWMTEMQNNSAMQNNNLRMNWLGGAMSSIMTNGAPGQPFTIPSITLETMDPPPPPGQYPGDDDTGGGMGMGTGTPQDIGQMGRVPMNSTFGR